MAQHVQDTVFEIIKLAREAGIYSLRKSEIMEEIKKTPFQKYQNENYKSGAPKLDRMVEQALYHLHKNKKIKHRKKGWAIDMGATPYKPVICKHLTTKNNRDYCPIKKCYIGSPRLQCEVLHGSESTTTGWEKTIIPMCPGYTKNISTKLSRNFAKKQIEMDNQKREQRCRYATPNPRDPLSKSYLPKLYKM
jgi:hypothetical protein